MLRGIGGGGGGGATLGANTFTGDQQLGSTNSLNWNADTYLFRDAANVLAQRNSTTAQLHNIYNTYTDASNYERMQRGYAGNVAYIDSQAAGTGTVRNFELRRNGTSHIQMSSGRNFLGVETTLASATQLTFSDGTDFNRGFVGVTGQKAIKVTDGSTAGGALQFQEMGTAPTAPATNLCFLFAQDSGGGKTRLVVRFPTGADVVLATEA